MARHAPGLTATRQRVGFQPLIAGGTAEADSVGPVARGGGGISGFERAGASPDQIERGLAVFSGIGAGRENRIREDQRNKEWDPSQCHYFSLMTTSNPVSPAARRAQ